MWIIEFRVNPGRIDVRGVVLVSFLSLSQTACQKHLPPVQETVGLCPRMQPFLSCDGNAVRKSENGRRVLGFALCIMKGKCHLKGQKSLFESGLRRWTWQPELLIGFPGKPLLLRQKKVGVF